MSERERRFLKLRGCLTENTERNASYDECPQHGSVTGSRIYYYCKSTQTPDPPSVALCSNEEQPFLC